MGYLRKGVEGFGLLSVLKVMTKGIGLAKIVIVARILSPESLGLFGLATVVLAFAEKLTETGINTFLVQRSGKIDAYVSTAWVVSIIRGCLIATAVATSALFLPKFYGEQSLAHLLLVAAAIPFIKGWINPSIVKFWKELQYGRDVVFRGVITGAEAVASVSFVLALQSPVGLLFGLVFSAVFEVAVSLAFISPRPVFTVIKKQVLEILRMGTWLNLSTFLSFLLHNLDDLIVGKLLGTTSLGYYQTAYKISQSTVAEVGELGAQAVFPIYSSIQGDRKRLLLSMWKALIPLAAVLLIPVALLLSVPEQLVRFVLGEKWLPILPVLPWLVLSGYIQALHAVMYPTFLAIRKPMISASLIAIQFAVMITLIIPLANQFGLQGVGISVFVSYVAVQPFMAYYLSRVASGKL